MLAAVVGGVQSQKLHARLCVACVLFHGESPSGASSSLLKGLDHQDVRNCSLLFFLSHLCRKFFVVILCIKGEACPEGGPTAEFCWPPACARPDPEGIRPPEV